MKLIQILLPLAKQTGAIVPPEAFLVVRETLIRKFGGVTAYGRTPADGVWNNGGNVEHDKVVLVEVMCTEIDEKWWSDFENEMRLLFDQKVICIRGMDVFIVPHGNEI